MLGGKDADKTSFATLRRRKLSPHAACLGAANRGAKRSPAALTGKVTSDAEGAMEGVRVVSAKKAGSIVTVSVITDAQGRYRFPANRLAAGKYTLKIRAIGRSCRAGNNRCGRRADNHGRPQAAQDENLVSQVTRDQ